MAARPRLLVTGFGAFPGAPENPTESLVNDSRMAKVARLKGVDLVAEREQIDAGAGYDADGDGAFAVDARQVGRGLGGCADDLGDLVQADDVAAGQGDGR